jgi:hypothetical protein
MLLRAAWAGAVCTASAFLCDRVRMGLRAAGCVFLALTDGASGSGVCLRSWHTTLLLVLSIQQSSSLRTPAAGLQDTR